MKKTALHIDNSNLNQLNKDLGDNLVLQNIEEGCAYLSIEKDKEEKDLNFRFQTFNASFKEIFQIESIDFKETQLFDISPFSEPKLKESIIDTVVSRDLTSFEYYSSKLDKYFKITISIISEEIVALLAIELTDNVKLKEKNKKLVKIFNTIRQTNELILKEKQKDKLLNKICHILTETTDFIYTQIILFDSDYKTEHIYGVNKEEYREFSKASLPCIKQLVRNEKTEIYTTPSNVCNKCDISNHLKKQIHIVVPIKIESHLVGGVFIVTPDKYILEKQEQLFLLELANDIAYALFNMGVHNDLAKAREKIRMFYNEIEKQNSKLKTANKNLEYKNKKLKKANEKALESDRLKSVFLANISHEIRTPLNGILGFSQLLTKSNSSTETKEEYAELIAKCGDDLLHIVNNVLDISRIETNQLTLNCNLCNINEILDDLYEKNRDYIDHRDDVLLICEKTNDAKLNKIWCDGKKVFTIFNILVKNSIKFTNKGYIKFGYKGLKDNNLHFFVEDTGLGIKKENYRIIFERFRQVDESNTRRYGGAGLGLAIAKGFIELMKGQIWVESEHNKGTVFHFTIPYQTKSSNENLTEEMDINKISQIDWSKKEILIVEDDIYSLEYLTELLSDTNIKIKTAQNGTEALDIVKESEKLDLILMDIQLPGISGDKVTQKIREFNKDIPVIAQTAHAMVNDKENYIKAGCTDYLSKPINISELFSVLHKYF